MPRHPESLTGSPAGSGLLDAPTSADALAVAREVGARVADPARVAGAVAAAARQTAHPASAHWRDHAVGQGHAGLALLFGALDHHDPDQGWDRTAHQHLALAAQAAEALPRPPAGLFAGLAGLGLVAVSLSGDGTRYRRLLATVDQALVARIPALTATARTPGGLAVRELDLISGLSGIGAYLLLRPEAPGVAGALRAVLGTLVALTGSDRSGPRWRTPPDRLSPEERSPYPDGYLNCGLAHGIPGPL
ncbi:MAG TPA: lanthionine synthetase LanC family protein, partial [Actinomycetes bacterium]|nr:lanthionine synthetase LanC family protein [Actinomycetes bacterium]